MPEQQFKRNIAYKFRVGDLLIGKPIIMGDRFSFLELGDRKIIRINIIGNIVDKYQSPENSDKKYSFLTLDDGSGQIKIKAFGEDTEKLQDFSQGQTVIVIGVLRHFNNELYISPEIIKEKDSRYLLIRKLEVDKENKNPIPIEKSQITSIKDKILDLIKDSENDGGIETDKIITNSKLLGTSPDIINQEIQKLLEEGIVFEPRPGKIRWLG